MSNTWARGIHIQMNTKHKEVILGIQGILENGRTESQISKVNGEHAGNLEKKASIPGRLIIVGQLPKL